MLIYVGAKDFGHTLTGAATEFRSVTGYAGEMVPQQPTCMIVLVGFEIDRARQLIDNYEPSRLILGLGLKEEAMTDDVWKRNVAAAKALASRYSQFDGQFEFSLIDPVAVKQSLVEVTAGVTGSNVVIAPLNTKLSTIGAGLFAHADSTAQVCYAAVESYVEEGYSIRKPGFFVSELSMITS